MQILNFPSKYLWVIDFFLFFSQFILEIKKYEKFKTTSKSRTKICVNAGSRPFFQIINDIRN